MSDPPRLAEIVERLRGEFDPERIVLFGSWARDDARADSDVDLLVIARAEGPTDERMARAHHALRGVPVPVDVFVCSPEEAATFSRWLGHAVAIALRDGWDAASRISPGRSWGQIAGLRSSAVRGCRDPRTTAVGAR